MPQRPAAPGSGSSAGHRRRRPARPGRSAGPRRPSQQGRPHRPAPPRTPPASELERALTAALSAPAPAATTFAELGLPGPLVAALREQGIDAPFAIQARALPDALAGRDVLGRAQTGSGKTLAFGLPLLARLAHAAGPRQPRAPRGLVLVPTRELARQVAEVLAPLGRRLGVRVTTVYGGAPMGRQIEQLARGVDIVVATPGRLIDLLERGAASLAQVDIAVVDEADHMADLGFLPAVTRLLDETPPDGQRMLFSATLDRDVDRLVTRYLTDPALHAVAPVTEPGQVADHQMFVLPAADKVAIAAEIAGRPDRTLIFVRTKHGAGPGQAAHPGRGRGGRDPRRPQSEPAPARPGRVRRGLPAGAGRDRRGRPRPAHRRCRPGRALRPAERPQGLPAPLGPHRPGRRDRDRARPRRSRAGPRGRTAARGGRGQPGPPPGAARCPGGP